MKLQEKVPAILNFKPLDAGAIQQFKPASGQAYCGILLYVLKRLT